jgi:hypothetical protein
MPEDGDPSNRSQVDFPGTAPARCVWPEICVADPASQGSRRGNPQVARREPVVAADGAVSLAGKLSPALERVDSSFGAPGTAVNRAVDAPVPVIAGVDAPAVMRERWPERLFNALQNDQMPCIERPGVRWSELRVTPAMPPHGPNRYG